MSYYLFNMYLPLPCIIHTLYIIITSAACSPACRHEGPAHVGEPEDAAEDGSQRGRAPPHSRPLSADHRPTVRQRLVDCLISGL